MMLRRFMKHISDQNWFAVGLDVIVVIVGIFLGLQVQNWYEDRADRGAEKTYLNRMHTEASDVIEQARVFNETRAKILKSLQSLSDLLVNNADLSDFTNEHCAVLTLSHVYANRTVQLPTVSELVSSGGLELIENGDVRNAMAEYSIGLQLSSEIIDTLKFRQLDFAREHPDLVVLTKYSTDTDIDGQSVKCDFQAMKVSPVAKNHVINSTTRYFFFVKYIASQYDILVKLHRSIDIALNITHEEQET